MNALTTEEEEMKKVADEVMPEPDPTEEPEENLDNFMANAEIELWLSTDGKQTVHLKTNEPDGRLRKKAIARTMELYDFVLTRYGTKQAQAVKEYGKGNGEGKPDPETCPHTQFKFAQSHTEKNPGKWFKSCVSCGKFLGWQS